MDPENVCMTIWLKHVKKLYIRDISSGDQTWEKLQIPLAITVKKTKKTQKPATCYLLN